MSKCISSEGEYSDHELAEQPRFMCARCFAFDEDAALAALDEAERERDVLGKAAFAAILASGEDTDGARSWADYFRPLIFPTWDVAVQQAVTRLREDLAQSDDEAEAAEAALARVRALHRVDQGTEGRAIVRCVCEERWPCPTVAALAPVTEEGDKE